MRCARPNCTLACPECTMTFDDLLRRRAELDCDIALHRVARRDKAIAEIHALMARHGITPADVSEAPDSRKRQGSQRPRRR